MPESQPPEEILSILQQRFPQAFAIEPVRPLKINIHLDLRAACPDLSNRMIARALKLYAKTEVYRQALIEGAERIDLNGQASGVVAAEHVHSNRAVDRPIIIENQVADDTPPVAARLEVNIKITQVPTNFRVTKHGWYEFMVQTEKCPVKISIRPKVWNKLLQAEENYPHWIASISGRIGKKIRFGGFELEDAVVQIFQRSINRKNPEDDNSE